MLVSGGQFDSGKQVREIKMEDFNKKISNTSGLIGKTDCNTKIRLKTRYLVILY